VKEKTELFFFNKTLQKQKRLRREKINRTKVRDYFSNFRQGRYTLLYTCKKQKSDRVSFETLFAITF